MPIPDTINDLSVSTGANSPLGVNNIGQDFDNYLRSMQAITRSESLDKEWSPQVYTHTYQTSTTFTINGLNVTSAYVPKRRIRAVGATTGTIYGTITASTFGVNTLVTVLWDTGVLQNEPLVVSLGKVTGTEILWSDIPSTSTFSLNQSDNRVFELADNGYLTGTPIDFSIFSNRTPIRFTDPALGVLQATITGTIIIIPDSAILILFELDNTNPLVLSDPVTDLQIGKYVSSSLPTTVISDASLGKVSLVGDLLYRDTTNWNLLTKAPNLTSLVIDGNTPSLLWRNAQEQMSLDSSVTTASPTYQEVDFGSPLTMRAYTNHLIRYRLYITTTGNASIASIKYELSNVCARGAYVVAQKATTSSKVQAGAFAFVTGTFPLAPYTSNIIFNLTTITNGVYQVDLTIIVKNQPFDYALVGQPSSIVQPQVIATRLSIANLGGNGNMTLQAQSVVQSMEIPITNLTGGL